MEQHQSHAVGGEDQVALGLVRPPFFCYFARLLIDRISVGSTVPMSVLPPPDLFP